MFIRLTLPLEIVPSDVLSRAVVDPNDPMREFAPPSTVPIHAAIVTTPDSDDNTKATYRHQDPWLIWDALLQHHDAGPSIYARLSLYGRVYYVIGARTLHVNPQTTPADAEDEDENSGLLGPPRLKVVELEYVQIIKLKDGTLGYMEYGTVLDVQLSHARRWTHDHPIATRVLKGAGIGVGVAATTPLIVGGILGAIGFTAGGVAAGSIAAGIQAGIGNVAAGSLFAICQSVGAAGMAAGTVVGIGGGAAAATVAGDTLISEVARRRAAGEPEESNENSQQHFCKNRLAV